MDSEEELADRGGSGLIHPADHSDARATNILCGDRQILRPSLNGGLIVSSTTEYGWRVWPHDGC